MSKPEGSEEKVKAPSSMREMAEGIKKTIAERSSRPEPEEELEKESEKEEKPCVECEEKEKEKAAAETPKQRFFILDKETKQEIPAVFKSRGKEYIPDTVDKLMTWTGLGIHSNEELREYKENKQVIDMIVQAHNEGRLIIKDSKLEKPSEEEKAEGAESEDIDEATDPQLFKERKARVALEGELKEFKKNFEMLQSFVMNRIVNEEKGNIEREMEQHSKEFPLAKRRVKDVWKLLGELDEDKKPKYNVKEAMKTVNEELMTGFKEFLKENPEYQEKDKIKKEAIQEYLGEKEEKEKAPVSAPSGQPADMSGPQKEAPKSMKELPGAIRTYLDSKKQAGKKF